MNLKKFSTKRDESEEVLDEFGATGELLPQLGILRRDAHRAGVQVAHAHHHAAHDDERRSREAEFLGAKERRDDHVAARLHLAVDLDDDTVAQLVENEHLLCFRETEFPRQPCVLDARER